MKEKIEAIIFDMDGVIVDSEPIHDEARKITCEKYDIKCPPYDPDSTSFRGKGGVEIFRYIVKEYNNNNLLDPKELADHKTKTYLEIAPNHLKLIPGALEFIKSARKRFKKLALTTSAPKAGQEMIFDKFNLSGYFDAVVTREEIKNGKPHPESFIKTLEKIGVLPEKCLVVEDSDNGIIAAKKAGCVTIGIITSLSREKLQEAGADYIVNSFEELEKILEE